MNRRSIASIVLLAPMLLGIGLAANGCSAAAPGEREEAAPGQSGLTPDSLGGGGGTPALTCTTPFTAPEDVCLPIAGGQLSCFAMCVAVTQAPAVDVPGLAAPPPLAPPAALAALGCTWGVAGPLSINIWACPASVSSEIPTYLGTVTSCSKFRPRGEPPCSRVATGTNVTSNPDVGDPKSGWILVEEFATDPYGDVGDASIGGGCQGGCPDFQ